LVIEVADTNVGRHAGSRALRAAPPRRPEVVAITGSAGKTTTKDVIAELLSERYQGGEEPGNLKQPPRPSTFAVGVETRANVAVMELGMNHAGEIRLLVDVARPEVRVWTNVGESAHRALRRARADCRRQGWIIEDANPESPFSWPTRTTLGDAAQPATLPSSRDVRRIGGGRRQSAAVEDLGLQGTSAQIVTRIHSQKIHVPTTRRAQLSNVLAATAVALEMSVDLPAIARRVEALKPSPAPRLGAAPRQPDQGARRFVQTPAQRR
jgi:UDP-N-acetylmuramoyl-tripeptide--D-alanyl-D-alanine ligase